jgi:putative restriction endonuclease
LVVGRGGSSGTSRLFLRVWADQISQEPDGEWVQVYWTPPINSHGDPERVAQLQSIEAGAEGLAVLCTAVDPMAVPRNIRSFDEETLLRLGTFTTDGQGTYARVLGRVQVRAVMSDTTLAQDLAEIARTHAGNATITQALIAARVGQGKFRARVLQRWQGRCDVTGSAVIQAIRASHIKPWREATDAERLDPDNGLPLVASLDALFDAGLISFDATGQILLAEELTPAEHAIHGLTGRRLSQHPVPQTAHYLRDHTARFAANNLRPG